MHNLAALPVKEAFAGPGGWSEALKALGITDATGYEWDTEACATAEAAGHKRVQADVSMVDLRDLPRWLVGVILSPPCQSFSSAGKQKGKLDKPRIMAHVDRIAAAGRWLHYSRDGWHDDRSPLVLEPLRWVLTMMPAWVALEQVPAVLPLWEAFADVYRAHGYHVATGILSAEQYGVAQTRKRAFLIARRCPVPEFAPCPCEPLRMPAPTHRAYRKGVTRAEGDPTLLPWVSMADALGWGLPGRPSPTVTAGGTKSGGAEPIAHLARYADDMVMRSNYSAGGPAGSTAAERGRTIRNPDEPSVAMTSKAAQWQLRQSAQVNATVRHEDEPAPTITAGHDRAERVWEPADGMLPLGIAQAGASSGVVDPRPADAPVGTITGEGTAYKVGTLDRAEAQESAPRWNTQRVPRSPAFGERPGRDVETEPSFTITGSGNNGGGAHHAPQWSDERPATTVAGDARIWPPGHKVNGDDRARLGTDEANSRYGDRAGTKAVRVSVPEAAVLQSFRPDYPFQGSKTAQYRQVGDAVPPLLAEAVLRAVLGL